MSTVKFSEQYFLQTLGASSGLSEGSTMENTATIDRGFWDIDYAFLGTAGGRSNGPSTGGAGVNTPVSGFNEPGPYFTFSFSTKSRSCC